LHLVCYGVILTEPIHDFLFSRFDNMTSSFHVTSGLDKSSMETRVNDKTRPRIHAMRAARQGSPHRGRIPLTSLERLVDIWPQTGDIFYSLALNSEDETRIMIDLAWHGAKGAHTEGESRSQAWSDLLTSGPRPAISFIRSH